MKTGGVSIVSKVISIYNQKVGVGKTTTAANLGVALAMEGERVLLIDLDPQSDLSACLGLDRTDVTMANPTTGYFTKIGEITPVAYVVEDGSTLTFYYDANKATRTGTVYAINQKRAEALSPGQHPGHSWTQACRPVRAKAFKQQET